MAASRCRKLRKDDVEPIEAKSKVGGDGSNLRSEVTVSNSKIDGFKEDPTNMVVPCCLIVFLDYYIANPPEQSNTYV